MAWFNECYSRILVDNHISEFDPSFMASFNPAGYAGQMKKAGVDASMIYASDHNGNCYFPTVVGHMHTGLKGRDIFGETVECVLNEGIVPLAYHSVVFFNQSAWEHPSWRTELPGGSQHGGRYWFCCPNSEEYREFCRVQCAAVLHYPVQGIFIDMVFWPGICSCHNCREKYLRETGREIPTVIQWDTNEWVEFQRARERWMGEFAVFLTAACNAANPDVTVTQQFSPVLHGWALGQSPMIPDACTYSSGDFYGGRFHQSLALKAMDVFSVEKPCEFFTSRCVTLYDHTSMKSKEQMACSAAATLANGGAFVLIDAINPDGTLCDEVYERMGSITDDLKPFLDTVKKYKPTLTADLGVYFSMPSHMDRRDSGKDYTKTGSGQSNMTPSSDLPPIKELLTSSTMLTRSHIPYRLIRSDRPDFTGINTLMINDCAYMTTAEVEAIRDYVKTGGKLIATGCTSLFDLKGNSTGEFALADVFGVSFSGSFSGKISYLGYKGELDTAPAIPGKGRQQYVVSDITAPLVKATTAQRLADLHGTWAEADNPKDYASIHSNPPGPALEYDGMTINKYGEGVCIYISTNILAQQDCAHRTFGTSLIAEYGKAETVLSTNAPDCVEITLLQCNDSSYILALVNCQEQLPNVPARDVNISIKLPGGRKAAKCTLISTGQEIPFKAENDSISILVDKIETIEMVHIS